MKRLQNLGNCALLAAIYAAVVIMLGAWWKAMEKLFCIGYGC